MERSRDIYWHVNVPIGDLKAQVVVALLQLGLVQRNSDLWNWLVGYIEGAFRFRVQVTSQFDRSRIRKEVALIVTAHVVDHWSFPEDYRAFRKYVAHAIRLGLGAYAETRYSAIASPDMSTKIAMDVSSKNQMDVGDAALLSDCSPGDVYRWLQERRLQAISTKSEMDVGDAALFLGCSRGYVYRLLRKGRSLVACRREIVSTNAT